MKIALVTGSYPPETCGVGDYTYRLEKALTSSGISVEIIRDKQWRLRDVSSIVSRIRAINPDLVHLQYPSIGYGWRLAAQALSLILPSVVTLHEVSMARIPRKISLIPFALRSRHLVFTSAYEFRFAQKLAPWISHKSSVIPIGSNILAGNETAVRRIQNEIVCFGLFRPNKGLEDVLALASLLKKANADILIRMVGKTAPAELPYYEELRRRSGELPIVWDINMSDDRVADILSEAMFGYLPFPDGASERRGSLLALLAHGVITITTKGSQTPPSLEDAVFFAQDPEQVFDHVMRIKSNRQLQSTCSERGRRYAAQFNWDAIAQQHAALYRKILSQNSYSTQKHTL